MTEKLCFLVSPIGNEGSEVRRHADTVRWIVRNALAKFGFHTVRFDETSFGKFVEIQPECVHLVETADFSVIVLTGRYPNVLYEAGRRHACGKPYLQLLQEGDLNPIKLPGARTISYRNIETTDGAAKLTLEIEEYMKIYGNQDVAAGFQRSAAYAKDKLNATEGILNWGTLNMLAPGTKQVNQSGGITLGDGSTVIGGNFVVANSIKDSFHNVELSNLPDEFKEVLKKFITAIGKMTEEMQDESAKQVARDLDTLIAESTSPSPRKQWWQLSVEGLKKAAQDVGEIGRPVLELAGLIISFLMKKSL